MPRYAFRDGKMVEISRHASVPIRERRRNMVQGAAQGLKQIEEREGIGRIEQVFGMSAKQIKRVWNDFKTDDQPAELGLS